MFRRDYRVTIKIERMLRSSGWLAAYRSRRLIDKYSIIFSPTAKVGKNLKLPHCIGIVVGRGVPIGNNCTIYHQVTLGQSHGKFPSIGNDVIIYAGAKVIGDVKVGDGAIIGANAVVTRSVPKNAIVGGIPARVLRYRDSEHDKGLC